MKYYAVSDVHGFFSEMKQSLTSKGFFDDTVPHKLIVCGDMMDRGNEAVEMQNFMLDLLKKNELIFIRGNHEDLLIDMIKNFKQHKFMLSLGASHHNSNGTWSTALQLSGMEDEAALANIQEFLFKVENSPFYKELIPASRDYFETENHIFVHGWIPCITEDMPAHYRKNRTYKFNPDWRIATPKEWEQARWFNGMDLAELHNIVERGKRIVCGHWHSSYGHCYFERTSKEFGALADHTPFYSKNIIAIDACTALSKTVNCIVIEEDEVQ